MQYFSNVVKYIQSEASPKRTAAMDQRDDNAHLPSQFWSMQLNCKALIPSQEGGGGLPASFLEFDQVNVSDQCRKWVKFDSCANGL